MKVKPSLSLVIILSFQHFAVHIFFQLFWTGEVVKLFAEGLEV